MNSDLLFGPIKNEKAFEDNHIIEGENFNQFPKSANIASYLTNYSELMNVKFICVCIPCYNEDAEELMTTLVTVLKSFEFMVNKLRLDGKLGNKFNHDFQTLSLIIIPIFDGVQQLSNSMIRWLQSNFPNLFEPINHVETSKKLLLKDNLLAKVYCSKWWYLIDDYCQIPSSKGLLEDKIIHFHLVPIVKSRNLKKHNSHQWFFRSMCDPLENSAKYALLTDCGTSFKYTCLAMMVHELYFQPSLIGVTARQRVAFPGIYFHPCEKLSNTWLNNLLKGSHKWRSKPCYKCYLAYFLSPCPLQGFEFEATLILNSAMFNLVEALPVLPGPCQLVNLYKFREFYVMDEYLGILMNNENIIVTINRLNRSKYQQVIVIDDSNIDYYRQENVRTDSKIVVINPLNQNSNINNSSFSTEGSRFSRASVSLKFLREIQGLSFTEFLRQNMIIAEDRILSFVAVFSTGHGTKWIPGATFYYQPEVTWTTLLRQRRRWINGTFAAFCYYFFSTKADERINGATLDSYNTSKNFRVLKVFWLLQLFQLLLALYSPAIFGAAIYIGLLISADRSPIFSSALNIVFWELNGVDIWTITYLIIYAIWAIYSSSVRNYNFHLFEDQTSSDFQNRNVKGLGVVPEWLCQFLAILGFLYIFPVYYSVWQSIIDDGVTIIGGLVIASLLLPIVLGLTQSVTSSVYYMLFLPWFLSFIVFYLVFITSYSFARLWDTTWGNRETENEGIDDTKTRIKFLNFCFTIWLVISNWGLTIGIINLFKYSYEYTVAIMFIAFSPMIGQLFFAFIFVFIALPYRSCTRSYNSANDAYKHDKLLFHGQKEISKD